MKQLKLIFAVIAVATMIASCKKEKKFQSAEQSVLKVENERVFGCELLPASEYAKLPKANDEISPSSRTALPYSYFIDCPPIGSQGTEGSCVAWSTAYAARSITRRNYNGGSFNNDVNVFSPEFVYNQTKVNSSCSSGSYVTNALNLLLNKGVCTWNQMPYSSLNGCSTLPNATQTANAATNKISSWRTVSRYASDVKNRLATHRHPIVVAGPVDLAFKNLGYNQIYTRYNSNNYVGSHCYLVVGYSDDKQAFKVMNSWGTNWGTNGFGWIAYSAVTQDFWTEGYVMYH